MKQPLLREKFFYGTNVYVSVVDVAKVATAAVLDKDKSKKPPAINVFYFLF